LHAKSGLAKQFRPRRGHVPRPAIEANDRADAPSAAVLKVPKDNQRDDRDDQVEGRLEVGPPDGFQILIKARRWTCCMPSLFQDRGSARRVTAPMLMPWKRIENTTTP
jgi:hypothetical protein